MLLKLIEIYNLVKASNYQEAAHVLWKLIGELMGWSPTPMLAFSGNDEIDACIAECEKIKACDAGPTAMAADETGNPAVWIALVQVLVPIVLEWLKKRREG